MHLKNKSNNILVSKLQSNKQKMILIFKLMKHSQNQIKSTRRFNKSNNRYDINQINIISFNSTDYLFDNCYV
jgi:hypothetical protein